MSYTVTRTYELDVIHQSQDRRERDIEVGEFLPILRFYTDGREAGYQGLPPVLRYRLTRVLGDYSRIPGCFESYLAEHRNREGDILNLGHFASREEALEAIKASILTQYHCPEDHVDEIQSQRSSGY